MSVWTWPACTARGGPSALGLWGGHTHTCTHTCTRSSLCTVAVQGRGCAHHPPELVVGVAHLVRTELGDEDLDDADEDEEVDLQWSGVSHEGPGSSVPCPGQPLSQGAGGPRGQSRSPGLTKMARNTGKRRIHQKPILLLVVQHLQRGGTGTARQPLNQAAARAWPGIGSPSRATATARHPAPCTGRWHGASAGLSHRPHHPSTCPMRACPSPHARRHHLSPAAGAGTHWMFS